MILLEFSVYVARLTRSVHAVQPSAYHSFIHVFGSQIKILLFHMCVCMCCAIYEYEYFAKRTAGGPTKVWYWQNTFVWVLFKYGCHISEWYSVWFLYVYMRWMHVIIVIITFNIIISVERSYRCCVSYSLVWCVVNGKRYNKKTWKLQSDRIFTVYFSLGYRSIVRWLKVY